MIRLLLLILLVIAEWPSVPAHAASKPDNGPYQVSEVFDIYDGDTGGVEFIESDDGNTRRTVRIKRWRLLGAQAPEIGLKASACERTDGFLARDYTSRWLEDLTGLTVRTHGLGTWGRTLVTFERSGRNLTDDLVAEGLAIYWWTSRAAPDWVCR